MVDDAATCASTDWQPSDTEDEEEEESKYIELKEVKDFTYLIDMPED